MDLSTLLIIANILKREIEVELAPYTESILILKHLVNARNYNAKKIFTKQLDEIREENILIFGSLFINHKVLIYHPLFG